MEDIINFMTKYAIFPIALICFVVGYVIKHFIPKMPNKFIPLILAILGVFLNVAFNNFTFTFDIVIAGMASGLVSTGSFEMVRNLLKTESKKNETENKIENNKQK